MKIKETLAIQQTTVRPHMLNSHQTLFGGEMFSLIDTTCAISVSRFCRAPFFTVAINQMEYYAPAILGDIISIESFVCGAGTRSVETIAKMYKENLHGQKQLIALCVMTYALAKDINLDLPTLEAETQFEKMLLSSYNERKALNLQYHKFLQEIRQQEGL